MASPKMARERTSGATRREVLAGGAGLAAALAARPARADAGKTQAAIRAFTGDAEVRRGRVKLDIPVLVESGNSVPVSVNVDSPMTAADHVKRIALFTEKNPLPDVARFHLGPRAGRASVATRIRLADSQTVTAIAELSDGSYWSHATDVIITLPACAEG
jgi:sulfur-oxidizing protein SoxY